MKPKINLFFENIYKKYVGIIDAGIVIDNRTKTDIDSAVKNELAEIVKSIIQGEFIIVDDDYIITLNNLSQKHINDCRIYIFSDNDLTKYFESHTIRILSDFTTILIQFFNVIEHFKITTNHYIHSRYNSIVTKSPHLYELCAYCNLFILDYAIEDDITYYEKLVRLEKTKNYWHSREPFKNLNIFDCKFNLLKYKWLKRQKYNKEKLKNFISNSYSEKYIFNNHVVDLDKKIKINEPYYSVYKEWINKIEFHYFEDKTEFDFVRTSKLKDSNLDTYDLYLKVKYFKDINPNQGKLEKLSDLFDNLNISNFSTYSVRKNNLYYLNNFFSFLVSYHSSDEGIIDKKFLEIKVLHENQKNNNFFLYYKYLDFKLRKFKNLQNPTDIISIDIEELKNLLHHCKSQFDWCKKGFNKLYDFDIQNCIVNIEGINVYHASSFTLPLSVAENQQIINRLEREIIRLENTVSKNISQSYFTKSTHELKEIKDKFETELKENNKKSIEMISLFTAVISFIVGTVGSYQFIKSITQGLIFLILFGITISIFLLLIFISNRDSEYWKHKWKRSLLLIIPYTLSGVILCYLFNHYKKNESPESVNTIQQSVDSLKMRNKKLDSELKKIKEITSQRR